MTIIYLVDIFTEISGFYLNWILTYVKYSNMFYPFFNRLEKEFINPQTQVFNYFYWIFLCYFSTETFAEICRVF